jgi:hypothetical protein
MEPGFVRKEGDGLRNQAWLLKNSTFLKTAEIWGIENV